MAASKRVGVRELRQNLSVYLRRVQEGEVLEVTERGKPVARLTPASTGNGTLDGLIAEGRVRAARGDWRELGAPPPPRSGTRPPGEVLDELRQERL